jgi:hypothetical protein
MTNGRTITLKRILANLMSRYPLNYNLSMDEAAEWVGTFISTHIIPVTLKPDICEITIHENKGALPCNIESIIQTAKIDGTSLPSNCTWVAVSHLGEGTAVVPAVVTPVEEIDLSIVDQVRGTVERCDNVCGPFKTAQRLLPMRWATDSFHTKYHCSRLDYNCGSDLTYQVNGNYIFTSFSEGKVAMAFMSIPLDEDGYPLLPADGVWEEAFTLMLAERIAFKLYLQGNLSETMYEKINLEKMTAVGKAITRSKMMSPDEMESFKNSVVGLIPRDTQHNNFFRDLQSPQRLFTQPRQRNAI